MNNISTAPIDGPAESNLLQPMQTAKRLSLLIMGVLYITFKSKRVQIYYIVVSNMDHGTCIGVISKDIFDF